MNEARTAIGSARIGISADGKWNRKMMMTSEHDDRFLDERARSVRFDRVNQPRPIVGRHDPHARRHRGLHLREFGLDARRSRCSAFSPKRMTTMPPTTSPLPSRSATPRRISGPRRTCATSRTRIGVPPVVASERRRSRCRRWTSDSPRPRTMYSRPENSSSRPSTSLLLHLDRGDHVLDRQMP